MPSKAYGTGIKSCMMHHGYPKVAVPCSKVPELKTDTIPLFRSGIPSIKKQIGIRIRF